MFRGQNLFSVDELGCVHEKAVLEENGEVGKECVSTLNTLKILYLEKRSPASSMRDFIR